MNTLFLEPVDVWLFRDGRPFDAGSAHRAESMFPPYPTVIQGAIRTHQLEIKNIDFNDKSIIEKTVGKPDDYGNLRLRGPFLARIENGKVVRYFPQPADAMVNEGIKLFPAQPTQPLSHLKTSQILPYLFSSKTLSGKQSDQLWLSQNTLIDYLDGKNVEGVRSNELYLSENRTGIGMVDKRVVDEGMLYEVGTIRLKENVGLVVEMDGYDEPEWHQTGYFHLGGEKRLAYFSQKSIDELPLPSGELYQYRFKIYFATPTYFENGWQPSSWKKFFEGNVKLIAAALSHYETVGGFNWVANPNSSLAHRPARRFVPAGSVYYFEGKSQLKSDLIQQAVTEFGAEIGFGQIIIKEW
jgi:CRISPR-associated protein Cmr3